MKLLSYLGRRAAVVMALGVFAGLALPDLATLARPLLTPTVVLMLTVTLLRLNGAALGRAFGARPTLLAALVWLLLGSPLLAFWLISLLGVPEDLAVPLLVWSGSPPLVSLPAIAFIMGLDGALTLLLMVIATFAFPFILPGLLLWLIGIDVEIGAAELTLRLALMIAGCALVATVIRRMVGREKLAERAVLIDGILVLLMLVFAVSIMDGVRARLESEPLRVLGYAAAAFGASLAMQVIGALVFFWADLQRALAIALASGNRNMALMVAAAGGAFGDSTLLFFAVVQFPIYMLPALLKPVYRAISKRSATGRPAN